MATVRLFSGFKTTFFEKFENRLGRVVGSANANSFSLADADNTFRQDFVGTFQLTKKGKIKSGSISEFSTFANGLPAWSISDVALSIDAYSNLFKQSKQSAFESLFGSDDLFIGSSDSDSLFSYAGSDSVVGGDGNDFIDSGLGNDSLDGGSGADSLVAGLGDDQLNGGIGDDTLDGGIGEDILVGGFGNDTLDGDTGADLLTGFADTNIFITRIGASPEFTSLTAGESQSIFLNAGQGVDIITDFNALDVISSAGSEFRLPDSADLSDAGGVYQTGRAVFAYGDWVADNASTGLNRGSFELTFDGDSPDLLFFILPQGIDQFPGFTDQQGNFISPSVFGSEIFILLNANSSNFA